MRSSLVMVVLAMLVAACGVEGRPEPPPATDLDAPPSCTEGETRCDGLTLRACEDGDFVIRDTCLLGCSAAGCADCDPSQGDACDGADVVHCNDDWTFGQVVETCGPEATCVAGACEGVCTAEGVDLIYVVSTDRTLRSFDPRRADEGLAAFTYIGVLDCEPTLPPLDGGTIARPNSMAVSRDGVAWVAYNSGEIFWASLETAHCEPSGYVPLQEGFEKFGMGFVLDGVGATTEHLYLSGGPVDLSVDRRLARMEDDLTLTVIGPLTADGNENPELSGTQLGELWGAFPAEHGFVERIDTTSGASVPGTRIPVYALDYVFSWAVAHWGGTLWMFLDVGNPYVYSVDLSTGEIGDTYNDILPFKPIGAGVSTCVPVVIE